MFKALWCRGTAVPRCIGGGIPCDPVIQTVQQLIDEYLLGGPSRPCGVSMDAPFLNLPEREV